MVTFVCLNCKCMDDSDNFYPGGHKQCPACDNQENRSIICTDRLIDFYNNMHRAYIREFGYEEDIEDVFTILDEEFGWQDQH